MAHRWIYALQFLEAFLFDSDSTDPVFGLGMDHRGHGAMFAQPVRHQTEVPDLAATGPVLAPQYCAIFQTCLTWENEYVGTLKKKSLFGHVNFTF